MPKKNNDKNCGSFLQNVSNTQTERKNEEQGGREAWIKVDIGFYSHVTSEKTVMRTLRIFIREMSWSFHYQNQDDNIHHWGWKKEKQEGHEAFFDWLRKCNTLLEKTIPTTVDTNTNKTDGPTYLFVKRINICYHYIVKGFLKAQNSKIYKRA